MPNPCRRKGLHTAVGGRDEKSLGLLLTYIAKNINDPKFSGLLMEVMDTVLGKAVLTMNCRSLD